MSILVALAVQSVLLSAPTFESDATYRIREKIATSEFGFVVMAGTEKRHMTKAVRGKRKVDITFDVQITEKQLKGAVADKWASAELADLRVPDHGVLDDSDQFLEEDGVGADAFPIFAHEAVKVGSKWQLLVNGVLCSYTLDSLVNGKAVISTRSDSKSSRGSLSRSGSWTVETGTGRLLSWNLHSEVAYKRGGRETVDSSGELSSG